MSQEESPEQAPAQPEGVQERLVIDPALEPEPEDDLKEQPTEK